METDSAVSTWPPPSLLQQLLDCHPFITLISKILLIDFVVILMARTEVALLALLTIAALAIYSLNV